MIRLIKPTNRSRMRGSAVKRTLFLASISALILWPVVSPVAAPRCYPTSRFEELPGGGQIRDKLTKLIWQKQASSEKKTQGEANSYCLSAGSGFRLPTIKELHSILDLTTANPAINETAFPDTPSEYFWTSTPVPSGPAAWLIDFVDGALVYEAVGSYARVRCVR
jgi:hypothetical protein